MVKRMKKGTINKKSRTKKNTDLKQKWWLEVKIIKTVEISSPTRDILRMVLGSKKDKDRNIIIDKNE